MVCSHIYGSEVNVAETAPRLLAPVLRILSPAFIVASATMADKKHRHSHGAPKKSSNVPLAPAKAAKTPAPTEQADGSPKATDTHADQANSGGRNGDRGKQQTVAKPGDAPKSDGVRNSASPDASSRRTYSIPDSRLEKPEFRIFMSGEGSSVEYRIEGDLSAAAPPIRESKYLSRQQCIEIYRWMLLNRHLEVALENLSKQGKVVGGVYFGLGQEGCSCASAYALGDVTIGLGR